MNESINIKVIGNKKCNTNEIEIKNTKFFTIEQVINEPKLLKNSDMIFIVSDTYENTLEIAKSIRILDILTVAIILNDIEKNNLDNLKQYVTSIIPIKDDEKPLGYIKLISDLFKNKTINLDFEDVANFFQKSKIVEITRGSSKGQNGAVDATLEALSKINIVGSTDAIVYIIGGQNLTLNDLDTAVNIVTKTADNDVNVMFCYNDNEDLIDEIIIVILVKKD